MSNVVLFSLNKKISKCQYELLIKDQFPYTSIDTGFGSDGKN